MSSLKKAIQDFSAGLNSQSSDQASILAFMLRLNSLVISFDILLNKDSPFTSRVKAEATIQRYCLSGGMDIVC